MKYLLKCVALICCLSVIENVIAADATKTDKRPVIGASSEINVTNAFFYIPVGASKTTMGFFTISNNSNNDFTITGVSTNVAKQTRLMPAGTLIVPAHQSVALKSSGQYLQINELKTKLNTGDELQLTLSLSNGKKLQIIAVAKSAYDQLHGR